MFLTLSTVAMGDELKMLHAIDYMQEARIRQRFKQRLLPFSAAGH